MKNTGKICHIRITHAVGPTVYIYNETNNKMICQSNVGGVANTVLAPLGNAHEALTYRNLLIDYGQ